VRRATFGTCLLVACLGAALACGGSVEEPQVAPARPNTPNEPVVPPGSLGRGEVVKVVDGGLGTFLQQVQVEASLKDGKFEGFRILSLQPENFWRSVDLQPGDVVRAVNGRSIEEPNDAYDVFESLRTVTELRVQVSREGRVRELAFPIVGAPMPKAKSSAAKSSPAMALTPTAQPPQAQSPKTQPPKMQGAKPASP
jgi:hypothetical protein